FIFAIVFTVIHRKNGIKYFKFARLAIILNMMILYGFIYANVLYGESWTFLIPTMVILLMGFRLGLVFCFIYFFYMLYAEFAFGVRTWDVFFRFACVFWGQVAMVSIYEALRVNYNKRLLEQKEEIEFLNITDHLTKLYNRKYFLNTIDKEFARAAEQRESLCILLVDMDRFKDYNDIYGHLQGDKLLVSIAEVCKKIAKRSSGLAFRIGGAEFGILIPNMDYYEAFLVAEKIRIEVCETDSTVSVGVACILPSAGETSKNLLKLATDNVCKAKEMGRNRIVG
ncbi:MAG: GGDEF domain-containing protein, partial [Fibromonadaceae bacterium]|nr:GGDEF domain-containing protein [Fibromonadaceae bacterium]